MEMTTLLCHRDVTMGSRCFKSLADLGGEPVRFVIHDDGSLTDADKAQLLDRQTSGFEVARIVSRREADERVAQALSRYPHCTALRKRQAYAIKLFDIPLLNPVPVLRYMDSDVLFLRRTLDFFALGEDEGCLFMQDQMNAYALRAWHMLDPRLRLPQKVNSGIFAIRPGLMDLEAVEWLLAKDYAVYRKLPWFEQTCWAWLARNVRGRLWDGERVRIVAADTDLADPELVAAHFVTTCRARMAEVPAGGVPALPPVRVQRTPMQRLNPVAFLAETLARSLRHRMM